MKKCIYTNVFLKNLISKQITSLLFKEVEDVYEENGEINDSTKSIYILQ